MSSTSVGEKEVIPPSYRNTAYDNPEWVLFIDSESGDPYFYSTITGETSWDDPEPPLGTAMYTSEPSRAQNIPGERGSDEDTSGFEIGSNSFLHSMIEKEIDRGLPLYLSDDWRSRPARKQAERDLTKFAYKEGSEMYNMWYHKFTGDRFDGAIREGATTLCDPWLDSGVTQGDSRDAEDASFCIWFAKGCCTRGSTCRYKHRVPTREDDRSSDQMVDVFGRERHSAHKDDMGGVGSFMKECRCLYISEITLDRSLPDCVQQLEAQLWKLFHPWGPIESIRVIPNKLIAFVKYEYRSAAEFAKVACADQPCGSTEAINVRWAFEDPNPRAIEQGIIDTRDQFFALVEKRIAALSVQERVEKGLISVEQAAVVPVESVSTRKRQLEE